MATNFICSVQPCGLQPEYFGLAGTKLLFCPRHASELESKHMLAFPIAAYDFVTSPADFRLFEERKRRVEKVLQNVSVLERACGQEFISAQSWNEVLKGKAIRVLEDCFKLISSSLVLKHSQIKQELRDMRESVSHYLKYKDTPEPPYFPVISCDNFIDSRLLRYRTADISLQLAKTVNSCWRLSPLSAQETLSGLQSSTIGATIASLLREAADPNWSFALEALEYAQQLSGRNDHSDIVQRLMQKKNEEEKEYEDICSAERLLREDEMQRRNAEELLLQGCAAKKAARFEEAREKLARVWAVSESCASRLAVEAGLELGEELGLHYGCFSQADDVLRRALDIEARFNNHSERTMKLMNAQAGLNYHRGNFQEAQRICGTVFDRFNSLQHSPELYWEALLLLAFSYGNLSNHQKALDVVRKWKKELPLGHSPFARGLRSCVLGKHAARQRKYVKAVKRLQHAQVLFEEFLPNSVYAAVSLFMLATCYYEMSRVPEDLAQREEAETHYVLASSLFDVVAPKSLHAAGALQFLGQIYETKGKEREALSCYERAQSVYSAIGDTRYKQRLDQVIQALRPLR